MMPVDYQSIRDALVFAVMTATGLDQDHVVMLQPEVANWPRPSRPYIAIHLVVAAKRYGDDVPDEISENLVTGDATFNSGGPRGMLVSFDSYAEDHEQAYDLMCLLQGSLDTEPTQIILAQSGIAVWKQRGVLDMSQLLEAGWEGRAHMDVEMGIASNLQVNIPFVASVSINGMEVSGNAAPPSGGGSGGAATVTLNCLSTDQIGALVAATGNDMCQSADCTNRLLMPAIGFIIEKPTTTTAVVQLNGVLPTGLLTGLAAGRCYFVSTNGTAQIAPVTGVTFLQPVGVALDSQSIAIHIASTPIQRS